MNNKKSAVVLRNGRRRVMRVSRGATLIFSIPTRDELRCNCSPDHAAGRRTSTVVLARSCRSCINPYTGSGGCRCQSGSRSLLASLQFSPSLNKARPCRNQLANDDILFEAHQVIRLSLYRCPCQDTCGLLEGGCRQEAIRIERRLGDTQEHRL